MDQASVSARESSTEVEAAEPGGDAGPSSLRLTLMVDDPEVVEALSALPEGRERNAFARTALRIGVLALTQARGRVDAETVRNEGEKLIGTLKDRLEGARREIDDVIARALKDYFDPKSGRFSERVERLVKQDGELEQVMRAQTQATAQALTETLAKHVGDASPLLKSLAPGDDNRFLQALKGNVEQTLTAQTEKVLKEFSLDNPQGALKRLVSELTEKHGALTEDLQGRIDEVVGEFSLDDADSALSRLVSRVEQAQKTISAEFSLDAENSALSRMRRDLVKELKEQREASQRFQEEVKTALEGMRATKAAAAKSTTHGHVFQDAVLLVVEEAAKASGDVAHGVGNEPGAVPSSKGKGQSKVGDAVLTLGPDSAAAGARIVVEAKEEAKRTLKDTLEEIDEARRNRQAQVGLFVHSKRTAPAGLAPLARYGDDVLVVWDAEADPPDVMLTAGLMVAKAMAVKARVQQAQAAADVKAMDQSVEEILRHAAALEDVTTWTTTIKNNAEKVLAKLEKVRAAVETHAEALKEQLARLAAKE